MRSSLAASGLPAARALGCRPLPHSMVRVRQAGALRSWTQPGTVQSRWSGSPGSAEHLPACCDTGCSFPQLHIAESDMRGIPPRHTLSCPVSCSPCMEFAHPDLHSLHTCPRTPLLHQSLHCSSLQTRLLPMRSTDAQAHAHTVLHVTHWGGVRWPRWQVSSMGQPWGCWGIPWEASGAWPEAEGGCEASGLDTSEPGFTDASTSQAMRMLLAPPLNTTQAQDPAWQGIQVKNLEYGGLRDQAGLTAAWCGRTSITPPQSRARPGVHRLAARAWSAGHPLSQLLCSMS